ncbi:hypothetical protein KA005_68740, partial [bacterium]|nr:hypothetical protein [bacterium]
MAAEGVFPKSDGDILYASEVNVFNRGTWYGLTSMPTVDSVAILAHSTTDWTLINGTATMITGDAGASWANASSDDGNMTAVSKVSVADPTKAISCDSNSGNVIITSDSGDNWTNASTDPAGITKVFDLSFPTATVAVVACDLGGAARGIFFSTDAGDNWTICTSGPAVDVMAIDMVDGSDGIAIDVNQNIWTTSDGGDNWSDS